MAMFQAQTGGQGFFSAGNAFGQAASDAYQKQQQWLAANDPNYNNAPKLPGVDDFSADRQRIEQAMYGKVRQELDQRYGQETDQFNQTMANQGVDIGSERYRRERELFDKSRNEAYNNAQFQSMLAGADEQSRLFDMGLRARQQSVSETDAIRASRLAEMAAMLNPALTMEDLLGRQNIADMDRKSRDELARMQDATQRYGYDQSAAQAAAERDSALFRQRDQQGWQSKESRRDRKVQRESFRARGGGGGGGGGGALDLGQLLSLVEQFTGESLAR